MSPSAAGPNYDQVVRQLEACGIAVLTLGNRAAGRIAVIPAAGRVIALSAPDTDGNALWVNPRLADCTCAEDVAQLPYGPGGLRLWHAPEGAYMWSGAPDLAGFSNYRVPREMDPGSWAITAAEPASCRMTHELTLRDRNGPGWLRCRVDRRISLLATGRGLTVAFEHTLGWLDGAPAQRANLWHLLQLPVGSQLILPVHAGTQPTPYFNPSAMPGAVAGGRFRLIAAGNTQSKVGFGAAAIREPLQAVLPPAAGGGRLKWTFAVDPAGGYVDAPPGQVREDQVVQFWDGFGFAEMEYHTPACGPDRPSLRDASVLTYET